MYEELCRNLEALKLNHLATNLDNFVASVTKSKTAPLTIIEQIVRLELEEAKRRCCPPIKTGPKDGVAANQKRAS